MDWLFNRNIPEAKEGEIIFKPLTKTFLNGLASSYDFTYDSSIISKHMDVKEFQFILNSLNEELTIYWPCQTCLLFGYLFAPCTLGLSLLCPYSYVRTSKLIFLERLRYFNLKYFNSKNLNLTYHQSCCTSWLKLEIVEANKLIISNIDTFNDKSNKNEGESIFYSQNEVLLNSNDTQMV